MKEDAAAMAGAAAGAPRQSLAELLRIAGRGPKLSRPLTMGEAEAALRLILEGGADPHQVGALLMLLRYRGETAEEVAGFVRAARGLSGADDGRRGPGADLDWPSYGAGRTRGEPYFLLAALALASAGVRVVMHGSNRFSAGVGIEDAISALGLVPATSLEAAGDDIGKSNFAYLPLAALDPGLESLLGLREVLGVRSILNSVVRLLDPLSARAGVAGVFHPAYAGLHLRAAARLDRPALAVLKGAGGEAERNPAKPVTVHLHRRGQEPAEILLAPLVAPPAASRSATSVPGGLLALWEGRNTEPAALATVLGTIALALLALGRAADGATADRLAQEIWAARPHRLAGKP